MRFSSTTLSGDSSDFDTDRWTEEDLREPPRPKRDWKKAFLVLGLGSLSWVATYVGMLELIQSNMGDLSISHKVIIGFSVAMLMTMIIWLLDQMFAPLPFSTKLAYVFGYIFLTLISVGFGFGFYWKVLESRSEASRSAESAVSQVKTALFSASARLDQLQTTLDQLTKISSTKAIQEREQGTSCPNSRPGDGPRRKLRDDDAARFSFASQFARDRAQKAKTDMAGLDVDLKMIASADPSTFDPKTGTRNEFLKGLTRKLELTATGFNAFRTDPQLRQIRSELADRASKTRFPKPNGGTFICPDPQLQSALRGVVRAIDQLPELGKPQIATVEGAQAVVEAFRRLTATFYGVLTFKLPPSADELRALQQKAVQSVENAAKRQAEIKVDSGGLSKRDYIPLAIALFVDLCLLLVSIGRPMNRLHGLVPKMREAERGPVYQILSRFDDIHRDKKIREKFEVFRHVVFDFNGDYYVAVPLDAPRYTNVEEANVLQQEAHLLSNLFASFEKEKIFSRVYNPLLTRKTIQKKLGRQGSKFANSQAFRTYRFRDGAWSEIILGAVMGASRRAQIGRMHSANERGPELKMPANEDRISEPHFEPELDQNHDRPDEHEEDAAVSRQQVQNVKVDPTLREKYGPYAQQMAETEPELQPETSKPRRSWPYRKPEPPPQEAVVDVNVAANSNTTPSRQDVVDPDNVILMPRSRSSAVEDVHDPVGYATALRKPEAAAAAQPEPADEVTIIPDVILAPVPVAEAGINVRITERTADFTVPATDAQLPYHLSSGEIKSDQLSLDFDILEAGMLAHDRVTERGQADLSSEPIEAALTDETQRDDTEGEAAVEPDEIILGQDRDDPMLRVAARFAAARNPAE